MKRDYRWSGRITTRDRRSERGRVPCCLNCWFCQFKNKQLNNNDRDKLMCITIDLRMWLSLYIWTVFGGERERERRVEEKERERTEPNGLSDEESGDFLKIKSIKCISHIRWKRCKFWGFFYHIYRAQIYFNISV